QEKEYTEFLKPDSDKINIPDITVEEKVKEQGPGDEYKMQAREALEYQFRADSLHRLANRYRITLDKLSGSDRQSVKNKILALEQEAFDNQRIADSKYRKAADISSMEYDERPVFETRDVKQYKPDEVVEGETDTTVFVSDTIKKNVPEEEPRPYVPVLEIFSDNDDQSGPIPVNNALPEGLIYRIQLAALRNPKEISFFKGLGPVSIYRAEGSNINFYYTGIFRLKKDAERALVKVQQKGFKDAFILAQLNGSRVSMEKAGQLEEQWSEVSLYDREVASDVKPAEQQEPPTLVYRVQVLKVKEKVDDDELDLIERLANKRSYDILKTVGSEYVYLIGKFITFESAAAYADLLYKNGMKEAKVVAYLGRKEIPLETAKKLFDLYFDKL
ncbi:MAG TPA: hypothetical protein DEQ09_07485, partial [Bacteroidales bacterium]|nr:hypothetical protein [Bacteroidales bacterium]